ncbi:hypothetical protein BC828DRAFT_402151 [Blastocladiella britannica]|nr:hypothetical protein BC828DRAFT_402151 [Blastocladiella britannica]
MATRSAHTDTHHHHGDHDHPEHHHARICAACTTRAPVAAAACPGCTRPLPVDPLATYFDLLYPPPSTPSSSGPGSDGNEESPLRAAPTAAPLWLCDLADARRQFLSLQRAIHPDKYAGGDDGAAKSMAEGQSAVVNRAHTTLRDALLRAEYLLDLLGIPLLESSAGSPAALADPQFLAMVMDTREAIDDAETLSDLDAVSDDIAGMRIQAMRDLGAAFALLPNPLAYPKPKVTRTSPGAEAARGAVGKLRYLKNMSAAVAERRAELE